MCFDFEYFGTRALDPDYSEEKKPGLSMKQQADGEEMCRTSCETVETEGEIARPSALFTSSPSWCFRFVQSCRFLQLTFRRSFGFVEELFSVRCMLLLPISWWSIAAWLCLRKNFWYGQPWRHVWVCFNIFNFYLRLSRWNTCITPNLTDLYRFVRIIYIQYIHLSFVMCCYIIVIFKHMITYDNYNRCYLT